MGVCPSVAQVSISYCSKSTGSPGKVGMYVRGVLIEADSGEEYFAWMSAVTA